jgi:adenine-specific DNA methylase
MIERNFDIPFIADLALREKQIQQNYRPIIAVHKWFARRPGTLFRGLILSEFSPAPLRDAFYLANSFPGKSIADPFMGGGTPLIEANRLGCDVIGFDINPMSYWIVKQEIEHIDLETYSRSAKELLVALEESIGHFYRTRCTQCGSRDMPVKYFLWIKMISCRNCHKDLDLFPGYLLADDTRHPKNVVVCASCGSLAEVSNLKKLGSCQQCKKKLLLEGTAGRNKCRCPNCGVHNSFPDPQKGPPRHRLFAIEYYCNSCNGEHSGRYFKIPDEQDLELIADVEIQWRKTNPIFVPDDEIPAGDETNRLHRWGYRRYREMFNARQLLGLNLSAQIISEIQNERVRNALATNFSDLLRYQNMLCRYDSMALKSLDIFSVHGFPVGLMQCESNLLGIIDVKKNLCIGSGGWTNIIEKYRKAKAYCDRPFEVSIKGKRKEIIPIVGEWIGDHSNGPLKAKRSVSIICQDATQSNLPRHSLDAVFTDPPYFGNVQYAELMDFCYVWLRQLAKDVSNEFKKRSTRSSGELTGNDELERGIEYFAEGLSQVFQKMARALKLGAPFVFTYHHNDLTAYFPVAVAMLDAGFACSASLPCPAEMGASIHIKGTGSSIVDTVFVCRTSGISPKRWLASSIKEVARLVDDDLANLREGNVNPTQGDIRCIIYGHLTRLAVWDLRNGWKKDEPISVRISKVGIWLEKFGSWSEVVKHIGHYPINPNYGPLFSIRESGKKYRGKDAEVSF